MEPGGGGARAVHRQRRDLHLVLLPLGQARDGVEAAAAVRGHGLRAVTARARALARLAPLELVASQHAVLGLLRGRLPPDWNKVQNCSETPQKYFTQHKNSFNSTSKIISFNEKVFYSPMTDDEEAGSTVTFCGGSAGMSL